MPLSPAGVALDKQFEELVVEINKLVSTANTKSPKRSEKAKARIAWANSSKDEGSHHLKGLRSKFIALLKPKNLETQRAVEEIEKWVESATKTVNSQLKYREDQVLKNVADLPSGNPAYEKSCYTAMMGAIRTSGKRFAELDAAYKAAKSKEKAVYDEMVKYVNEKTLLKEAGSLAAYKAMKKQFEEKVKELASAD